MTSNNYEDLPGFEEVLESNEDEILESLISPAMSEGEDLEEILTLIFPGEDLYVVEGANYGDGFIPTVPDTDTLVLAVNKLNSELGEIAIDPIDLILVYTTLDSDLVESRIVPVWESELEEEGLELDDMLKDFGDPLNLEKIRDQIFQA